MDPHTEGVRGDLSEERRENGETHRERQTDCVSFSHSIKSYQEFKRHNACLIQGSPVFDLIFAEHTSCEAKNAFLSPDPRKRRSAVRIRLDTSSTSLKL